MKFGTSAEDPADDGDQISQGQGVLRPSSNVEDGSRDPVDVGRGEKKCVYEIVDEQNVADLLAVTIDRDGLATNRANEEMRDPPLIFGAELPGSVDTAQSEYDSGDSITARVITNVLIGSTLRASIGAVEVEWLPFVDSAREAR